jgi:hypothetical protein
VFKAHAHPQASGIHHRYYPASLPTCATSGVMPLRRFVSANNRLSRERKGRTAGRGAAGYGAGGVDALGSAAFASSAAGSGGRGASAVKGPSNASGGVGGAGSGTGAAGGVWQPSRIDLARSYMYALSPACNSNLASSPTPPERHARRWRQCYGSDTT